MNEKQKEDLLKVGQYNSKFNDILGINIENLGIYRSKGLPSHILKPDYIGINPNEQGKSIELIKRYADNVMIGIKLNTEGEYLYVSTMIDVQESKISRRLNSGRIKEFTVDSDK